MAEDPLGAALKKIRDRAKLAYASPKRMAESGADVPLLLAAVDAALKLADKYDAESKRLWDQIRDADGRSVMTGSKSIDAAWNGDVAKAVRESIVRELTRKEPGNAVPS